MAAKGNSTLLVLCLKVKFGIQLEAEEWWVQNWLGKNSDN